MNQVKQHAKKLAIALEGTTEFEALKTAYDNVMEDEEAKALLEEYRSIQISLHEKEMQEIEITEEEVENANKIAEKVEENKQLYNLLAMEQILHRYISDISKIITEPLEKLYE